MALVKCPECRNQRPHASKGPDPTGEGRNRFKRLKELSNQRVQAIARLCRAQPDPSR